jgi:hypothetical protein
VPTSTPNPVAVELATLFTAIGAVGFLAGSLLILREGPGSDGAA